MIDENALQVAIQKAETELLGNILPFWIAHTVDRTRGGFYGEITNDLVVDETAPRGALLSSRILWTYAAAYRRYPNPAYLEMANWAYTWLMRHFWDEQYGGLYWVGDAEGKPLNPRKQIYGQAFGIYALAEYFGVTQNREALDRAIRIYAAIEEHSYDPVYKGYFEACTRDWQPEMDMRLSAVDLNEKKSMNTHLHILEAYTNLLRAWRDPGLEAKLAELIDVMSDHVIDGRHARTVLFFDERWTPRSDRISYGHDIETSWLMTEAAEVLGDPKRLPQIKALAIRMAQAVYDHALDPDGAIVYEADPNGLIHDYKEWWPQAEAAVGFLNAYQLSGQAHFLDAALGAWDFIETHLVDRSHGEWFRYVTRDGKAGTDQAKVSFWKCPYHNGRACMELVDRLRQLLAGPAADCP